MEPGTVFGARPPADLPDADSAFEMQRQCGQRLEAAGFERYEVSAYARGVPCQHNLNYWRFGDYLGLGAGAHGKLTRRDNEVRVERTRITRDPRRYLSALRAAEMETGWLTREPVDIAALPFEYCINALRLREGFSEVDFAQRTGIDFERVRPKFTRLQARGLLEIFQGRWRTSAQGFDFLNDVLLEFLDEGATGAPGARSPGSDGGFIHSTV